MEMQQADTYIDITLFTDEEIFDHPIFIHNFVKCILSIFVMIIYLVQTWVLFDEWQWVRINKKKQMNWLFVDYNLNNLFNLLLTLHHLVK